MLGSIFLYPETVGSTVQKYPEINSYKCLDICVPGTTPWKAEVFKKLSSLWKPWWTQLLLQPLPPLILRVQRHPACPLPSALVQNTSHWNFSHSLLKNAPKSWAFPVLFGDVWNCPTQNTTQQPSVQWSTCSWKQRQESHLSQRTGRKN